MFKLGDSKGFLAAGVLVAIILAGTLVMIEKGQKLADQRAIVRTDCNGPDFLRPECYPEFDKLKVAMPLEGYVPKLCMIDKLKGFPEDIFEGRTLAEGGARLLFSSQRSQHNVAYRMFWEVGHELTLHGGDGFSAYSHTFCGPVMEVVARHLIQDAFGKDLYTATTEMNGEPLTAHRRWQYKQANREWHNGARYLLMRLDIQAAIPFVEKHFNETRNELERIELLYLWVLLSSTRSDEKNKVEVPKKIADLTKDWPDAFKQPAVLRAADYYQQLYKSCGANCMFTPEGGDQKESEYFGDPLKGCPPESIFKELGLDKCPFKPS